MVHDRSVGTDALAGGAGIDELDPLDLRAHRPLHEGRCAAECHGAGLKENVIAVFDQSFLGTAGRCRVTPPQWAQQRWNGGGGTAPSSTAPPPRRPSISCAIEMAARRPGIPWWGALADRPSGIQGWGRLLSPACFKGPRHAHHCGPQRAQPFLRFSAQSNRASLRLSSPSRYRLAEGCAVSWVGCSSPLEAAQVILTSRPWPHPLKPTMRCSTQVPRPRRPGAGQRTDCALDWMARSGRPWPNLY